MNTDKENTFLEASRQALDEQTEHISSHARQQLEHGRHQALAAQKAKSEKPFFRWPVFYPAGAALATVLLLVLWLPNGNNGNGVLPIDVFEQLPEETLHILSAEEELELYEELDFMLWLDTQITEV